MLSISEIFGIVRGGVIYQLNICAIAHQCHTDDHYLPFLFECIRGYFEYSTIWIHTTYLC